MSNLKILAAALDRLNPAGLGHFNWYGCIVLRLGIFASEPRGSLALARDLIVMSEVVTLLEK